jgi:hypothetical protein
MLSMPSPCGPRSSRRRLTSSSTNYHIGDAIAATVAALTVEPVVYNIVDEVPPHGCMSTPRTSIILTA